MSHSKLSPSSAHRWYACPGSVREEAKYPDDRSSEAAIDGTHTHTLLEYCLLNPEVNPTDLVGTEMGDHDGTFVINADRVERVMVALRYVHERASQAPTTIKAEQKVDPGGWFGRGDIGGTCDVQLVQDGLFESIDYKDGMSPVSPVENLQLVLYTLGAILPYYQEGLPHPFPKVRLTIIQPKLAVKNMEPITSWDIPIETLMEWVPKLKAAAEATDKPDAPLVPGETQCKYCDHKGACSALAGKALEQAQVMFGDVELANQSASLDPHALTDDKIREIIEAKALITEFLSGVEEEALRRFKAGARVPGLKVVRGRGSRKWKLPVEEMEGKLRSMGIPKADVYTTSLLTPAQAAKLKWEKKSKGEVVTKTLSKRQLKTMEENYVEKTPGRMTVVLESDSRKEVTMDAQTMFAGVEVNATPEAPALPGWLT